MSEKHTINAQKTHACDLSDQADSINRIGAIIRACSHIKDDAVAYDVKEALLAMPSATSQWNNHTVACLLAELYDDTCACNYNDNDEWLPQYCEVIDSCPNPCGVACWEQFLTHRNKVKK